jgi:Cdc6-like AAA superfamily ATPase
VTRTESVIRRPKEQRQRGETAAAGASYTEAAALAASEGDVRLQAHALRHVAELAAERGAGVLALDAAQQAVAIYEADAAQSPLDLANAHRVRALAFACLGRNKDAARDWQAARCLYDELGVAAGVAECDRRLNGI